MGYIIPSPNGDKGETQMVKSIYLNPASLFHSLCDIEARICEVTQIWADGEKAFRDVFTRRPDVRLWNGDPCYINDPSPFIEVEAPTPNGRFMDLLVEFRKADRFPVQVSYFKEPHKPIFLERRGKTNLTRPDLLEIEKHTFCQFIIEAKNQAPDTFELLRQLKGYQQSMIQTWGYGDHRVDYVPNLVYLHSFALDHSTEVVLARQGVHVLHSKDIVEGVA